MEETTLEKLHESTQDAQATEALADKLEKVDLESSGDAQDQADSSSNATETTPRQPIIYQRKQLLYLSKSPLVKPPDGMPSFKSWFGELNEQTLASSKKEPEATTLNGNGRDRRYRRDAEEGDTSARPPFRAGLSQPSQMGNFKHQPLRGTDRDRDRDRDTGDLRSLSDKYDRERSRGDRMGLPSTILRTRDRDSAPHLTSERETQRSTNKKRNGESSEDWRRGAEPTRAGRDEHHARRDRDDRERPRSRVRDTSRQRERDSPPATRRDREDRERGDKRDRDRDEHRREHEFTRRERDRDRFPEVEDDGRRWRDDGKREERLANRRDKDRDRSGERERDTRDGWIATDDRESRGKRGGRERRYDEGRDKDEKRDKEKEPAWMDAYVPPSTSGTGILGGKGEDGEVDSIQAWKRDMKEREMKSKGGTAEVPETSSGSASKTQTAAGDGAAAAKNVAAAQAEQPLDEIQMIKLMIKQEEQKRAAQTDDATAESSSQVTNSILRRPENGVPGLLRIREGRSPIPGSEDVNTLSEASTRNAGRVFENGPSETTVPPSSSVSPSPVNALGTTPKLPSSFIPPSQHVAQLTGKIETTGPRVLQLRPTPEQPEMQPPPRETVSPSVSIEPSRSRFFPFGAQNAKATNQTPNSQGPSAQPRLPQQAIDPLYPTNQRASVSPVFHTGPQQAFIDKSGVPPQMMQGQFEANLLRGNMENAPRLRNFDNNVQQGFAPNDGHRGNFLPDGGNRDSAILASHLESMRAASININDRGGYPRQESMHHMSMSDLRGGNPTSSSGFNAVSPINTFEGQSGATPATYSTGKGSRMAKHFEKTREAHSQAGGRGQTPLMTPNGTVHLRQESQGMNSMSENERYVELVNILHNSGTQPRQQPMPGAQNQPLPQQSLQMGHPNNFNRHIPFNEPDDGRFAPDGLVPGLRPASHLARNRDVMNGPGFSGPMEDIMAFNGRLPPQQRAGVEQLFSGPNAQFNQGLNGGRGMGGFQQPPIRGGPSPIGNFNAVQGPPQRMPPGLANLGGRPPHDAALFVGGGGAGAGGNPGNFGIPAQNLHGGLQNLSNAQAQAQALAQLQNVGLGLGVGVGLGGGGGGGQGPQQQQQQMRGGQAQGGQFGLPMGNAADFRGGPGGLGPNPLLGLGGPNLNAVRAMGGLNPQQLQGPGQLPPNMGLRQQQQQQHQMPPPHLMQQSLPSQLQQQGLVGGQHNSDLMALLMGGALRE